MLPNSMNESERTEYPPEPRIDNKKDRTLGSVFFLYRVD